RHHLNRPIVGARLQKQGPLPGNQAIDTPLAFPYSRTRRVMHGCQPLLYNPVPDRRAAATHCRPGAVNEPLHFVPARLPGAPSQRRAWLVQRWRPVAGGGRLSSFRGGTAVVWAGRVWSDFYLEVQSALPVLPELGGQPSW